MPRTWERYGSLAGAALAALLVVASAGSVAQACDVCAIYTATEMREARGGFRLGVAEQFSRFTTLKEDGEEIDNPGEHLNSAITQLILGYDLSPRFGLQLTVPIIARDFRRRENGVITSGDETGFGDLSLVGLVRPFSYVTERSVVRTSLVGGLELPSGSPDRLREELEEGDQAGARARQGALVGGFRASHEADDEGPIGVHGHDLALGSGSVDGIIGGSFFASWTRLFFTAAVQYAMRTKGSFDYRYANEVTWTGGPGMYPYLAHERSLAIHMLVTGEHKGLDELDGADAEDTGVTAVYLGPGVSFTWGTSLAADVAGDLPVSQDNTSVQLMPSFRIRGGVSWRF